MRSKPSRRHTRAAPSPSGRFCRPPTGCSATARPEVRPAPGLSLNTQHGPGPPQLQLTPPSASISGIGRRCSASFQVTLPQGDVAASFLLRVTQGPSFPSQTTGCRLLPGQAGLVCEPGKSCPERGSEPLPTPHHVEPGGARAPGVPHAALGAPRVTMGSSNLLPSNCISQVFSRAPDQHPCLSITGLTTER